LKYTSAISVLYYNLIKIVEDFEKYPK